MADTAEEHGIAVRGGLPGDDRDTGQTARATAVIHDDRLTPAVTQPLRDQPPDDVGAPTRRARHDEANRLGGIVRCSGWKRVYDGRGERSRPQCERAVQVRFHDPPPLTRRAASPACSTFARMT